MTRTFRDWENEQRKAEQDKILKEKFNITGTVKSDLSILREHALNAINEESKIIFDEIPFKGWGKQ